MAEERVTIWSILAKALMVDKLFKATLSAFHGLVRMIFRQWREEQQREDRKEDRQDEREDRRDQRRRRRKDRWQS